MKPEDEQNIADAGAARQAAQPPVGNDSQPLTPNGTRPPTSAQQAANSQNQPAYMANGQPQPVAYDQNGNPLYAAPPQVVYMSRPIDPHSPDVPEEIKQKHEQSCKDYPQLNLSNGEYIINVVKRHPIGILQIWAGAFIVIAVMLGLLVMMLVGSADIGVDRQTLLTGGLVFIGLLSLLVLGGAALGASVYNGNRFYLTNESVIQEIQTGLFSKDEQTVSLANIEDASYHQRGILPTLLNFGHIRLSTQGDETTYRFTYVANPKQQIATLNNAVEAFKNGRPVE